MDQLVWGVLVLALVIAMTDLFTPAGPDAEHPWFGNDPDDDGDDT